jgi:hypothetical protein
MSDTLFLGSHQALANHINSLGGPQAVFMANNDLGSKIKRDQVFSVSLFSKFETLL